MRPVVSLPRRSCAQRHEDPSSVWTDWRDARLREAFSVAADVSHHRESLVLLAYRVIETHSENRLDRIRAHVFATLLQSNREGRQ